MVDNLTTFMWPIVFKSKGVELSGPGSLSTGDALSARMLSTALQIYKGESKGNFRQYLPANSVQTARYSCSVPAVRLAHTIHASNLRTQTGSLFLPTFKVFCSLCPSIHNLRLANTRDSETYDLRTNYACHAYENPSENPSPLK